LTSQALRNHYVLPTPFHLMQKSNNPAPKRKAKNGRPPKKNGTRRINASAAQRAQLLVQLNRMPNHEWADLGSKCLVDYAKAYDNPFTSGASCLPVYPSWPSKKLLTRQYGTFSTGTNGVGWIMAQPCCANNINNIWYTNATYAGDTTSPLTSVTGSSIIAAQNTASPYANASFGTTTGLLQQRAVIVALRIRYIGTDLNMSGSVFPIVVSDSAQVEGSSYNVLRATNPATSTQPINRAFHTIRWTVTEPDDTQYSPTASSYANTGVPMAIMVTGFGVSGAGSFEYEMVSHHEVRGTSVDVTPSYSTSKWNDFASKITDLGMQAARNGGTTNVARAIVGGLTSVARAYVRNARAPQLAIMDRA